MTGQIYIGYAGPLLGALAFNGIWAVIAALSVYIYTNRKYLAKNKFLLGATRPFHGLIIRIAQKELKKGKNQK